MELAILASKNFGACPFYLLKLNVFKKLRLRGLWARFWRPPGSILEASGLDFGGSGLNFPRFWMSRMMPEGLSGCLQGRKDKYGNMKYSKYFGIILLHKRHLKWLQQTDVLS